MKLYSKILGEGDPIIIMHGVFGMSDNWQSLGRQWSASYQVHLLDMRNHGRSPHSEDFSYDYMAEDLREYLDLHQLKKAHILGHSMGGKVAMLFAVLHEERVDKLIVADIAPRPYPPHHHEIISALKALPLSTIKTRSEAESLFALSDPGVKQFLLKNLFWTKPGLLEWRFNLPVISREIEKVGEGLPGQAVFNGDCLFIRGGKSDYVKEADLDDIANHFPRAQLSTIEGAGHWLHAEKPRDFLIVVNEFLES